MERCPTPAVSPLRINAEPVDADEPSADPVDQLPALYASALRLRDAGLPDNDIAERIGVHPEAMDAVFRLAEAKLALLLAES